MAVVKPTKTNSHQNLDVPNYAIDWVTPFTPSCSVADLLDTEPFRVGLKVSKNKPAKPQDFTVQLWTNIYHKGNNEGEWHANPMNYLSVHQDEDEKGTKYLYGVELVLTCLGVYGFTFRVKHKRENSFTWAETMHVDGRIRVKLPVKEYTAWIQEPVARKITNNVFIGNFNAAMIAVEDHFDSLLNMANDVNIFPEQFTRPVIYKRCPLPFGVDKPISGEVIQKAVKWLRFMSDRCKKVLVFSKTGHARSGSIIISYIYCMNPDLTFEEACAYVNKRSFVYQHKGLKKTLMALYPRD